MMTFPTIAAGTRANEAIGGYANFVAYCNALAAGVDSVTTTAAGAALKANNLSDLASASTARTNLGLGTMATATATDYLTKAGNLAGLADLPTARTNLGLGTAAVANTGTGASNVILGNDSRLTDTRTPSAASIVDAMIATTLSPSKITGTAAILGANTFTAQQFIDGTADVAQLIVKGASGQSNAIQEWQNSSATVLAEINSTGALAVSVGSSIFGASGPGFSNNTLGIIPTATTSTGLRVHGLVSQTADLQTWTDSSSTVLASVSAAGKGTFAGVTLSTGALDVSVGSSIFGASGPGFSNNTLGIIPTATTSTGLRVHGLVSQTGDLQTWTNSSSTVLASVSAAGLGTFAGLSSGASVTITATNGSFISQGVSGQWTGLDLKTGTSNRWKINRNGTAESGSNAGSNLDFYAYMDDGATVITPLSITRATGVATFLNQVKVGASTTTRSSLNVPHGTAPASPVDGDMWTTTAGLYVRINGATVGPLS